MTEIGQNDKADPVQAALGQIRTGLAALEALCPQNLRAELAGMQHAFQRLDKAMAPTTAERIVDGALLDRLLTLAGPTQADELLGRHDADLAQVARRIAVAHPKADYAEIHAATHVLISLAGSIGATGVEDQSRRLNHLAAMADPGDLGPLCHRLAADLSTLRQSMAQKRAALRGDAA